MSFFKNKNVQICTLAITVLGAAYYFVRRIRSNSNPNKLTSSIPKIQQVQVNKKYHQTQSQIKQKFDKILQNGIKNFQSQENLSSQQIIIVFKHLAITNLNRLRQFQQSNLQKISNYQELPVKQIIQRFCKIFKNQQLANQQSLLQNKDIISFLRINIQDRVQQMQIQTQLNEWLYAQINEQHKNLAIKCLKSKNQFLRSNDFIETFIQKYKQVIPGLSQDQLKYMPFILNLIISLNLNTKIQQSRQKSTEIYLATRKYAQDLKFQLQQWDNQVGCLIQNLNI